MFFSYFIPAYTFMTPNAEDRYFLGYYTIVIVGIILAVNLVWMIVTLIQDRIKQKYYKSVIDKKQKAWEKQQMEKKYLIPEIS